MAEKFILVLESSTDKTTVALGADGKLLSQEEVVSVRYSEKIIYLIDEVLSKNQLSIGDLYGLGIGLGPGSFTGTRAGISTVRALGQVLRKPVAGVSSMDAIAYGLTGNMNIEEGREIFVAIDARRSEVYGCTYLYDHGKLEQKDHKLMSIEEFKRIVMSSNETIFCGSALGLIELDDREFPSEELWYPQAKHLLKPVADVIGNNTWREIFNLIPIYWRPSDATPMAERKRPQ